MVCLGLNFMRVFCVFYQFESIYRGINFCVYFFLLVPLCEFGFSGKYHSNIGLVFSEMIYM